MVFQFCFPWIYFLLPEVPCLLWNHLFVWLFSFRPLRLNSNVRRSKAVCHTYKTQGVKHRMEALYVHEAGIWKLRGSLCLRVRKRRWRYQSTDPENTTKPKALLQGAIFHTSFLVLFPTVQSRPSALEKTPLHWPLWAHGRDKSPYSIYWLLRNPTFNLTSVCLPFFPGIS